MVELATLERWYTRKGIEGSEPEAHQPLAENPISSKNMFSVYVLWSEKLQKRYVGSVEDTSIRLVQHNEGKNRFTKGGIPWIIIHKETFSDLSSARKREAFLKSGVGRAWLDQEFPNYRRRTT